MVNQSWHSLLALAAAVGSGAAACREPLTPERPVNRCAIPGPQHGEGWHRRHQTKLAQAAASDPRVVLMGDSITQRLETLHRDVWKRYFEPLRTLNLGFGGDTTGNLLWRMQSGELNGLTPHTAVILIGTNNGRCAVEAEELAMNVREVVTEAKARLPQSRIVLIGLLPRDGRDISEETNRRLAAHYAADPDVRFVDPGATFRGRPDYFSDHVHPSASGSAALAEIIVREVAGARSR